MAGLALARRDFGRAPRNVFYVDRSLFDHCRVPDVGCEPVGEFGSDVSFSSGGIRLVTRVTDAQWNGDRRLECWEGY